MRHEVVRIKGGQLAMLCVADGEVMHPGVGPLAEAEELYVRQSRLAERLAGEGTIVLFDVGLGAGTNAVMARAQAERIAGARLELVSFDNDLGALELALAEEHAPAFGLEGHHGDAARALLSHGRHDGGGVEWTLRHGDLFDALATETRRADIVYWDLYSPKAHPDLWSVAAFTALRRVAGPRCTLYTYSTATAARVAMLLAGWAVGVGDSIGEKPTTTAAAVRVEDLARPLDWQWVNRLFRADAKMPMDAGEGAAARIAAMPQFQVRL